MDLIEHLQNIRMFEGLRYEQLESLAAQFKFHHYFPGEILSAQGELGNRFFIIDSGIVSLRVTDPNGIEQNAGVLPQPPPAGTNAPPINYFGEQMLTTQEPFDYQAYAVSNIDAYTLDRGDFDALIKIDPSILRVLPFIEEAEQKRTYGFDWIEPGEVVTEVFHKHWWLLVPSLLISLAGVVVAWIVSLIPDFFGLDIGNIVFVAGLVITISAFVVRMVDWQNDKYIVTTLRVAHVERELIAIELSEQVPFDKVIGSKIERSGISGILGVSNVVIQTAGRQEGNVTFRGVRNGPYIVKLIEQQRFRIRSLRAADQRERERERIQQKLREYILPHVVAKERAEAAAKIAPLGPPPPPSVRRKLQNTLHHMFEQRIEMDSVVTWRKHGIVLLKQELRPFGALIVFDAFLIFYALTPGVQALPYGGYLFAGIVVLCLLLGWVWWEWEDWRNDTYAVTMTQVVDAERLPLGLREKSVTAQLDQIQDVRIEVDGILPVMLGYGDLRIESAGQGSQMIFKSIANPRAVSEEVFKHIEGLRKRVLQREIDLRDRVTIDSLIGYDRIRKEEERHKQELETRAQVISDEEDDDESTNFS